MARTSRSLKLVLECVELIKAEYPTSRLNDLEFAEYLTKKLGVTITVNMVSNYRRSAGIINNMEINAKDLLNLVSEKYVELKLNDVQFAEFAAKELGMKVNNHMILHCRRRLDIASTVTRGGPKKSVPASSNELSNESACTGSVQDELKQLAITIRETNEARSLNVVKLYKRIMAILSGVELLMSRSLAQEKKVNTLEAMLTAITHELNITVE